MTHLTEEQRNDLVDGVLETPEFARMQTHLEGCPACRAELQNARDLLAGIHALPRGIAPARNLLPGIHAAIDRKPALPIDSGWRRRTLGSARWSLTAAALLLIAATALVTRALNQHGGAPAPRALQTGAVHRVSASARTLESTYESAIAELQQLVAAQRSGLQPSTRRLLEENVRVIDRALDESRAALRQDPGNEMMTRLLRSAYEKKLDLLRRATTTT